VTRYIADLLSENSQLKATVAFQASTIAAQAVQITALQQSNDQLSLQLQLANAAIEAKDAQIAQLTQTNVFYKASNNLAPVKWASAFYDQGTTGAQIQTAANICKGFGALVLAPSGNLTPKWVLPTFSFPVLAPGFVVQFPAQFTEQICILELEFGHNTTAYSNDTQIRSEQYTLEIASMTQNISQFTIASQGFPKGAAGGGHNNQPHAFRALHRMAFQVNPSLNVASVVIYPQFVNGGTGSSEPVFANYSCVLKMYYAAGWSYIP
jgi:hypothetical protein